MKNSSSQRSIPESSAPILLIVERYQILRQCLQCFIPQHLPFLQIREAPDGYEAQKIVQKQAPELVVTELDLPRIPGIVLIQEIHRASPETKVLVLARSYNSDLLSQALRAGAHGYVAKTDKSMAIIEALYAIQNGQQYLSSSLYTLYQHFWKQTGRRNIQPVDLLLTSREQQVLILIAEGYTTQNIADLLHRSVKTVETYRSRLQNKFGVTGTAALTRCALQRQLITLD